jgi:UDP-N-acetyl-D-galactosamine dehydrogenase
MTNKKIAIVGLGYVGLPLAVEFGKKRKVIGFDINQKRIADLKEGIDVSLEMSKKDLRKAVYLNYTDNLNDIKDCSIYIVTVPTPIDNFKKPDLNLLKNSTDNIGKIIKKGDIIIYESTVYPGTTEEICVPILEKRSKLEFNKDFYCGYSPERINPGDKKHKLADIKKVTSGSTNQTATEVDELYKEIITAGTHKTNSIKIAEAAKIIENTQRDLNIALVNELALIFNKMDIDTESVLRAAETKWNFLPFRPGLVGGHCIAVDPYYLSFKANELGYNPETILAGRKINDNMGIYIANEIFKLMCRKEIKVENANVLVMGFTFKENCPDHRNTLVLDLIKKIESFNCVVEVYDPLVNKEDVSHEYNIQLINKPIEGKYDAIILAVAHDEFKLLSSNDIKAYGRGNHVLYDVKYMFKINETDGRL